MDIKTLLNPSGHRRKGHHSSPSPFPPDIPRSLQYDAHDSRRKLKKDAAVYSDNAVNAPVNFPPHDVYLGLDLTNLLRRHGCFPLGDIREKSARRVPYTSEKKKDFHEKTGRDRFEIFQYEVQLAMDPTKPYELTTWTIVWDYQLGLVRTSPFFKMLGLQKTKPKKAIDLNNMGDVSISATGGSIIGQGYWMPYDVARHLAANFCWDVRHLLIPLFGRDFPSLCLPPDDPNHGNFKIDPAIVRAAAIEMQYWRKHGEHSPMTSPARPMSTSATVAPETPMHETKFSCSPWVKSSKPQRPQRSKHREADDEDDYKDNDDKDTNERRSFSPAISPQVSPRSKTMTWTAINRHGLPSPASSYPAFSPLERALTYTSSDNQPRSAIEHRPKRRLSKASNDEPKHQHDTRPMTASTMGVAIDNENGHRRRSSSKHSDDTVNAAHLLMGLGVPVVHKSTGTKQPAQSADLKQPSPKRTRRGSRY